MWILEVLGIVLLLGGLAVGAAFYAAIITGLVWMFFTGIEIVTAPVLSCPSGCFTTVLDSKPIGWMFIATPVLFLSLFIFNYIFVSLRSKRIIKHI
ncbi:hypothetical protein FH968_19740 [Buttiauxella sp. B2]|uniref:hypothetical protein n=1 Tax=Buttiauxella sp. B2 TaxID=2587812 RepID=UPI001123D4DF|nr:hypothetical protein [Buttiauxella sp. B2]TNV16077.1 hypothetical protein FH968_19740 [Buttiauxella sp. B2]